MHFITNSRFRLKQILLVLFIFSPSGVKLLQKNTNLEKYDVYKMQGLPFSLGLFCVKIKMYKNFKGSVTK